MKIHQKDQQTQRLKKTKIPDLVLTPTKPEEYNPWADFDPLQELEDCHLETIELQSKISVLTKDDGAKELTKQIDLANAMRARLNQEMRKVHSLDEEVRNLSRLMTNLRKLVNVDNNSKILGAIRKLQIQPGAAHD